MANTFDFHIATPEGTVYQDMVERVTVPTESGQITVLANHTPLVSLLKPGELVVVGSDGKTRIAIAQGFVEVRQRRGEGEANEMIILADSAERAEGIDLAAAQVARDEARQILREAEENSGLFELEVEKIEARAQYEAARVTVSNGM